MTYKENLHPKISRADWRLKAALSARRVKFRWQELLILKATRPEFLFEDPHRKLHVVYLDGDQVHKGKQLERDEEINDLLDIMGIIYHRYRYHAPMSEAMLNKIADEIKTLSET